MKNNKLAFTFIELVVSVTILIILSTLGFYSYSQHLEDARDTERKSDFANIKSSMKLYKQKRAIYPIPGTPTNILFSGSIIALQGKLDETVTISTLDKIPKDPYVKVPYLFSITSNKQEFQIAGTLENNNTYTALLDGDYKSVSKNIIPTIVLAISGSTDIEVKDGLGSGTTNRDKFIFNMGIHNIPYSLIAPYDPEADGSNFAGILIDTTKEFWQNIDYRDCQEIINDGKYFGSGEYQIINSTGGLININC